VALLKTRVGGGGVEEGVYASDDFEDEGEPQELQEDEQELQDPRRRQEEEEEEKEEEEEEEEEEKDQHQQEEQLQEKQQELRKVMRPFFQQQQESHDLQDDPVVPTDETKGDNGEEHDDLYNFEPSRSVGELAMEQDRDPG
jgi:hypothetical protein